MDKDLENLVCHGSQVSSSCDPPDPMSRILSRSAPWQDCSVDLLGPLPREYLVVVDYYSRFLEVAILKSTTSTKIIETITPMSARFGVPFSPRTDNGPQFLCSKSLSHFYKQMELSIAERHHYGLNQMERLNARTVHCSSLFRLLI